MKTTLELSKEDITKAIKEYLYKEYDLIPNAEIEFKIKEHCHGDQREPWSTFEVISAKIEVSKKR